MLHLHDQNILSHYRNYVVNPPIHYLYPFFPFWAPGGWSLSQLSLDTTSTGQQSVTELTHKETSIHSHKHLQTIFYRTNNLLTMFLDCRRKLESVELIHIPYAQGECASSTQKGSILWRRNWTKDTLLWSNNTNDCTTGRFHESNHTM